MIKFKSFKSKNLVYGVSDISFGSMRRSSKNFKKNLTKFLKSLGLQNFSIKRVVMAEEIFGSKVHICRPNDFGIIKGVDGLISNSYNQPIAVISADCMPILLFDSKNKVAAVLHGSRESLVKGIIKNAVRKMLKYFASKPKDILVGIGPHIRVCHYWLKQEAYNNLKNTSLKKFFVSKNGKTYFDLTKLAINQLKELGIPNKNIEDCNICTFCNYKKYFSSRKQELSPGIYKEKRPDFMLLACLVGKET